MQIYTNVDTQRYINVDIHKCRYTQMQIYTNADIQNADIHKCRYTQMHK